MWRMAAGVQGRRRKSARGSAGRPGGRGSERRCRMADGLPARVHVGSFLSCPMKYRRQIASRGQAKGCWPVSLCPANRCLKIFRLFNMCQLQQRGSAYQLIRRCIYLCHLFSLLCIGLSFRGSSASRALTGLSRTGKGIVARKTYYVKGF